MSSFTRPLIVTQYDPLRYHWLVLEEFIFHVGNYPSENQIHVPRGFITDGASIPRPFTGIFNRWDKHGKSAVIHDWLYATKSHTRKEADDIFLEGMEVMSVNSMARHIIYGAVRLAGWKHYNNTLPPMILSEDEIYAYLNVLPNRNMLYNDER